MAQKFYWTGNIAKSRVIAEILAKNGSKAITIFDYGCGDGGEWPQILADHPQLHLVGYEPYAASYNRACKRLHGYQAQIYNGSAITAFCMKVDYIVSFSVFEHVVRQAEFLRYAKHLLAPEGVFYLNYDDGHFRNLMDLSLPETWLPAVRACVRTLLSAPLAKLGIASHYQRRVIAEEVNRLVKDSGFRIERIDYHNLLSLKELAKSIPEERRQAYVAWWLAAEKRLNEAFNAELESPIYGDRVNLWRQMLSRTLCLRHR